MINIIKQGFQIQIDKRAILNIKTAPRAAD